MDYSPIYHQKKSEVIDCPLVLEYFSFMPKPSSKSEPRQIKVVAVGDPSKTELLMVLDDKPFPDRNVPTIFENYFREITMNNVTYTISAWDTAGQHEYGRLRPLS